MRGENRMTTATGDAGAEGTGSEIRRCERLQRALGDCNRRMPPGPVSDAACRHLNRALAECLVSAACPDECQAVRSLCSSAGTALKRSQCQQAQLSLCLPLLASTLSPNFPTLSYSPDDRLRRKSFLRGRWNLCKCFAARPA